MARAPGRQRAGHPEVDHVELFVPSAASGANSRNFVLCPGKAYDRSPCGTGTSAKLACLAADGKLAEDEVWVQESVIGSVFAARYRWCDRRTGEIAPFITGTAHVTAEATLRPRPERSLLLGNPLAAPRRRRMKHVLICGAGAVGLVLRTVSA